jgi:hypothetical protein
MDLAQVVADYGDLADKGALIDYAFHLIIADATEPASLAAAITSSRASSPSCRRS